MQTEHSTVSESLDGGRPMTKRFSLRRTGMLLLAGALLFVLAGDRGITAVSQGIDPLEVLNLQIKPNVIVALDTSGSMEDTPYVTNSYGGDHQRSKMWLAKQVLKAVFQDNQDKAAFMFGVYRFSSNANPVANMALRVNAAPNRFVYSAESWAAGTFSNPACTVDPTSCPTPNPATVTLSAQGPSPSMATTNLYLNSLYAFQWIQNSGSVVNNALRFSENGGPTCTVNVAPDFYLNGAALAAAIESAMNTQCGGRLNTYAVSYGNRVITLTALTRVTTLATATTATPHGFATGDSVTIAGATPTTGNPNWNGAKTITVTGPNTFTYAVTNGGVTNSGAGTRTATLAQTANRFTFRGTGTTFTLQWGQAASTIRAVLNLNNAGGNAYANANVTGTNRYNTPYDPRINLLARTAGNTMTETFDPDGPSTTLVPALDNPSPKRDVTTYNLDAQMFWNGQTVYVDAGGNACDIVAGAATVTPSVTLQLTNDCAAGAGGADATKKATFTWGGGLVGTGAGTCQGFSSKVPLIPCNQLTPPQYTALSPYLENQLLLGPTGSLVGYSETGDGTGAVVSNPTVGGVIASSNTPLAQTTNDVKTLFNNLWASGNQNITPIAPGSAPALPGGGISTHLNPKEKTIFILVTDGDQNCTPFTLGMTVGSPYTTTGVGAVTNGDDAAALGAAAAAQKLYAPISGTVNADGSINGDPASSVTTYVVAFGAGASKSRADWIAWGGSGMVRPLGTLSANSTWTSIPTQAMRDACLTCVDSFLAPDPDTLKAVLETVINQGASSGEFTAQQSLTDSIFELAGDVPQGTAPNPWSPMNPRNRYDPLVPHRFASTFTLPLFTGQIKAYTQGGPASLASTGASCAYTIAADGTLTGNACRRWSANDKLVSRVSTGMASACPALAAAGALASECNFTRLWNGATDSNVGSLGGVGIRRRIYTTSQNGVFGPTVDQLIQGVSPYRIALWPPQTASISVPVAPASNTQQGLFDEALGLPLDTVANPAAAFDDLRTKFKACMGANLPATCPAMTVTSGFTLAQMQRARREAREMILAFLAGAQFKADPTTGYPKRAIATSSFYAVGDVLYVPRSQILAESTLATPAVVSPPQEETPDATAWETEYKLYRDGPRTHTNPAKEPDGVNPGGSPLIRAGFALRNPDSDGNNTVAGTVQGRVFYNDDTRLDLKPVMSVLYAGTNSALHAFRAGPSVKTTITTACTPSATVECGGEELWAFVPYDQILKLNKRYLNNPQKRDPHDYMIARGIRFSDVFVPNPGTAADPSTTPVAKTAGGVQLGEIQGVWRKVLFVGRGKGGKYMTAIDVTSPAPFTELTMPTTGAPPVGPIVLWSRGNPDTSNGALQGQPGAALSNTQDDYDAYLKMGETWSVPAFTYIGRDMVRADNPARLVTATTRKPSGTDFVLYMGSGYGEAGEGTTFYSIDPLTGDIITSVDVEEAVDSKYSEMKRSSMAYANAIVANPIAFNPSRFVFDVGGVPSPNVAAAAATRVYVGDLYGRFWKFLTAAPDIAIAGADLGADQPVGTAGSLIGLPPNTPATVPHVFLTSGNDNRATGTFHNFGFTDGGDDTTTAVSGQVTQNGIGVYPPMTSTFVIEFDTNFRGTVQPATFYSLPENATGVLGRVFFAGTRFNAPNTQFAPATPPFPCRSSFDSVLYGLGAVSGLAAYTLPSNEDHVIFYDSRLAAISTQAAPQGSQLAKDEGLSKIADPIKPPPSPGLAPTTQSTQNIIPVSGPGIAQPAVKFGSTVCR
jgi:hypothetical protein